MAVVNTTPDSFSDGGLFRTPASAIDAGLSLIGEGADIVDVGGESTRPSATVVPTEVELARTLPVVTALARAGATVSIDTMKSGVAAACIDAGAVIVNDVSGGRHDPCMLTLIAQSGAQLVVGHWEKPFDHRAAPPGTDIVEAVRDRLRSCVEEALGAGVARTQLILDPGIGFGKSAGQNWDLLANLDKLRSDGLPLMIGTSRKRFLGELLGDEPSTPMERDDLTAVTSALAALAGVTYVRVHNVRSTRRAIAVARTWNCRRNP